MPAPSLLVPICVFGGLRSACQPARHRDPKLFFSRRISHDSLATTAKFSAPDRFRCNSRGRREGGFTHTRQDHSALQACVARVSTVLGTTPRDRRGARHRACVVAHVWWARLLAIALPPVESAIGIASHTIACSQWGGAVPGHPAEASVVGAAWAAVSQDNERSDGVFCESWRMGC